MIPADLYILTENKREKICFSEVTPSSSDLCSIPEGNCYTACGDFGTIFQTCFIGPGMEISVSKFYLNRPVSLLFTGNLDLVRWDYTLNGAIKLQDFILPQNCCNLFYEAGIPYRRGFPTAGVYSILSIWFRQEFILPFESSFYVLKIFLETVNQDRKATLFGLPIAAGPGMKRMIQDILLQVGRPAVNNGLLKARIEYLMLKYLEQITWYNITTMQEKIPGYDQDQIYCLGEYILKNLTDRFTLKALAARAGINEYRLKKQFKKIYGITLFSFIMRARLHKARELLATTQQFVSVVAMDVGFPSPAHFSKAFKKHIGISPSRLRSKRTV